MIKNLFFLVGCVLLSHQTQAQNRVQYFDGNDTVYNPSLYYSSLFVKIDTASAHTWQVGKPQKTKFTSAATYPNVIVTDTVNPYRVNDSSYFTILMQQPLWSSGIMAVRWTQRLDLDKKHDGGIVEFSLDTGKTWQNVFNNPYVYNFYGFDSSNKDTLTSGEFAFSGTDTAWKDIWLCFHFSYLASTDSIMFRFTLKSDSVDSMKDGWMMDNFRMHYTIAHTIAKDPAHNKSINVFPTATSGIVNIEAPTVQQYHIIETLYVINSVGKVVKEYRLCPPKFWVDISDQPPGTYFVKVKTNLYSGTYPITLHR